MVTSADAPADKPTCSHAILRIAKAIPDISQKILTTTLRNLEADGSVVRTIYAEVPPRTEYTLTPRARSFMEACRPMVQWALDHFAAILKDRQAVFRNQP